MILEQSSSPPTVKSWQPLKVLSMVNVDSSIHRQLCLDHKPTVRKEQQRIHEAGGTIAKMSHNDVLRVEGQLAMTRALGDFALNKDVIPPIADIFEQSRKSAAYVVLACDGIWDVMSNEEVAAFVCKRAANTGKLDAIAAELLDECLRRESSDNMTIYIVKLWQ